MRAAQAQGRGGRRAAGRSGGRRRDTGHAPATCTASAAVAPGWRPADTALLLLVLAVTLVAYVQVGHCEFVSLDDPQYVTANPDVQAGLSRAGARWALTAMRDGNWFPLTWLSHMAVVQAAGLDPRAHHLVNLALHALGAVLLFVALRRMTGARWPSALAAALFGVHPLHVESVAWVAERKDVLSGVFWMLALVGYAEYAKRPGWRRYLLVAVPFALGLLSKPMVVTLPFVLLLLDLWPLGRLGPAAGGWGGAGRLVREKAPLLAMSAASAVVTFIAQRSTGSVAALGQVPLGLRAANALDAWVAYAAAFFRPAGLAVFYPYPAAIPWWHTLAAALALLAVTALAARRLSSSPYLAVGWSWYLGTLVPVIGLVQVGSQARADRYTYIPSVGLSIVVAWGLAEVWSRHRQAGRLLAGAAAVGAGACVLLTWQQVQVWRTSATLFGHALAVTRDNFVALDGVGLQLRLEGRLDEAIEKFGEAVRIAPAFAVARNNLGEALLARGRAEAALPHLLEAVRLGPDLREARVSLGTALASLGRLDEAIATLEEAVRRWPDYAVARSKLALALAGRGRAAEGLPHARTAAALAPDSPDAHYALARVLLEAGRPDEAADEFARTLRLRPDFAECRFNLGNLLAARGDLEGAIREYRAALIAKPDDARTHANLGAALATLGRVDEAIAEFTEALRLDPGLPGVRANLEHARAAKR